MNAKASPTTSGLDTLKWLIVTVLVLAGVFGNAHYSEESLLYRIIALLVLVGIAGFAAFQTEKGRVFWALLKEARIEIRKVVWPTQAETRQTTLIVLAVVLVVAILLWGLDSLLSFSVSELIG